MMLIREAQSFPPVLCHPNPSGVQAGVGVGVDIPVGCSGAGFCPVRAPGPPFGAELNKTHLLLDC